MFVYKQNPKEAENSKRDGLSQLSLRHGGSGEKPPKILQFEGSTEIEQIGDLTLLIGLLADSCALAYRSGYELLGVFLEESKSGLERKLARLSIK